MQIGIGRHSPQCDAIALPDTFQRHAVILTHAFEAFPPVLRRGAVGAQHIVLHRLIIFIGSRLEPQHACIFLEVGRRFIDRLRLTRCWIEADAVAPYSEIVGLAGVNLCPLLNFRETCLALRHLLFQPLPPLRFKLLLLANAAPILRFRPASSSKHV